MAFSGFISTMKQCAKDLNTLAQKIANDAKTKFGPTVDKVKDGIDVVKAGADVVSTVVSDVTGDNVTIRSIQKGAADFDVKWDAFAKEINDKFNAASSAGKADILETFVKSNFGDDIFNLGSAIKNELPGVLDGLADYKEVVDSFGVGAKTAEEKAKKIQSGADKIIKATEKVASSLNEAVKTCRGKGYPVLDQLSKIGGTAAVDNLNKALNLGVAGATTATAANELKNAVKSGDLRGITDAMAKGATSVNDLLTQLNTLVPGFPKAQIPTQITTSIKRLQDGQAVYDAARSTLTALVADASGPMTVASLATLTSHFDKNWDNFSDKIDALFQVTPGKGQQAVLETVAKSMFGENVFYAGGAIKRQLPGVLTGVAGVQEAINTFGGSYRDPIEAATKIRSGVEKMVQSVEKISQSLNNMVKFYQGKGDISKGTGYPLLDTLGKLGDTKGIKALDTALRIGGGAAAVVGNAGALSEAIKNKDIKGTVAAAKKTIDDIKKLTKKGEYKADKLTIGNTSDGGNGGNTGKAANAQNNQQQQNQNNNNQKQLSGAATNSYVCSGATMRCTMGTSQASLTVLPIRTVNLTGKPMANISDHLSFVNLGQFGRCRSLGFPATAAATAAAHGKLTPMPCVHNTPFPWMGGKNDYIIKGDPALLKSSKCQCMWGGTISLVNDGQTYTGPADLSRMPAEDFEKNFSERNRAVDAILNTETTFKPANAKEEKKYRKTAYAIMRKVEKLSDSELKRAMKMKDEMPDNLSNLQKLAIAENNIQLEKALGITKGNRMSTEEADKQNANPNHTEKYLPDPQGMWVDSAGNRFSENPNYDEQYSINCATCSATYALRRLGFDVTAKGNTPGTRNEWLSQAHSFDIWNNIDGTKAEPTYVSNWMKENNVERMTGDDYKKFFEETCKDEGIYVVTVKWKEKEVIDANGNITFVNNGAHATILQRDADGKLYYIEPQVYESDRGVDGRRSIDDLVYNNDGSLGLSPTPPENKGVMRIDDKIFNIEYADLFNK